MKSLLNGLLLVVLASTISCNEANPDVYEADLIVYGGTSAGVVAAVQARRMGRSVILTGPDVHLGGLTSSGLGWTDSGNTEAVGGIAREFYHRIWQHYQSNEAWTWQEREEYGNVGQGTDAMNDDERTMWVFEPHVAEQVFDDWVEEEGVTVHRNEWLDREEGISIELPI